MVHQKDTDTRKDENELVLLAQKGDRDALTRIIVSYEKKVYNYALRFMQNREDAEDVLQETFLSVVKAINTFKGQSRLSTWIFRIATNAALMKLRSRKRVFESLDENMVDFSRDYRAFNQQLSDSSYEKLKKREFAEKINHHLDELPPKHRSVFLLRDIEGFSTNEVADLLHMTVPAVKSNLRRARIALRDKLSDDLAGE